MYRIRLTTGEEAVFRTVAELALAIRSGVVSPKSEVFHNAETRWLPLETHPEYMALVTGKRPAITAQAPEVGEGPGTALEEDWATAPLVLEPQMPPAAPPASAPKPAGIATTPAPKPASPVTPSPAATPPRLRTVRVPRKAPKARAPLVLAVGAGAFCLICAGVYLVVPGVRGWSAGMLPTPGIEAGVVPVPAAPDGISEPAVDPWLLPAPVSIPDSGPAAPPPAEPSPQPEVTSVGPPPPAESRLVTVRASGSSYQEAYAEARAEMDESFRYIQFRQVFAPTRFRSPDSLRAARRMVAAAGNILRVYRGHEVTLEQTYRPDDPGGRGTLREPFETTETARALLADVDSLFGLLVAQQGRFLYDGSSVRFTDPRSARLYADLRHRILLTLRDWRDAPDRNPGVTIPRLILALGADPPPPVR